MSDDRTGKPFTRLVHGGRRPEWTGPVVNPPVWRASTHLYRDSGDLAAGRANEDGQFYYGRRGAPTQWALAEALTEIEPGAHGTLLYPSGVAAIAGALLAVLGAGDELLMTDNAYQPSRTMAEGLLKRHGIATRYFDPLDLEGFAAHFSDKTRAVLLETPGSLTMEVCDIPALAEIAHEHGAVVLLDNTWATPLGFPALERGCDIDIMSLTKHVSGHSDVMMGSVAAGEKLYKRLRLTAQQLGVVVSPDDAALALRGLRTMGVRLAHETASALAIAEWLASRPEVAEVRCPMDKELWRRDFTGGCGLFSILLKTDDTAARDRFIDALRLFGIGYSWGGYESLVIPFGPDLPRTATTWPAEGSRATLGIRLSIGLEDPQDLIADLAAGFAAMEHG